jgi:hypothetical protein
MIRRVNKSSLDGTILSLTIGITTIAITSISYGDRLEKSDLREMGAQKIAEITLGTYHTEPAKVKLSEMEFRSKVQPLLQPSGYGNEQLAVVVNYEHPDAGQDSDLLDTATIVSAPHSGSNDSKPMEVEMTIFFGQLFIGNDRKTINQRNMTTPLAASAF